MPHIGQTITLWRNKRALTQSALAARSGVSRPNLSAIEQGARDLTLETLRRIALALEVSPGTLADGLGPAPDLSQGELDRHALDRIARLAAGQALHASALERRLAADLALTMRSKIGRFGPGKGPGGIRAQNAAVLRLRSSIGPALLKHLIRRVEKNLARLFMTHE